MSKRMLIDGTHPEEIRVVVTSGNRLEEYDVETSTKRQLKGNIYLAKVTRVEPSLQAAFVDYGGNRHGFLAFNEIHPDYYQIPIEDREALLAEEADLDLAATAAQEHVDDIDGEVEAGGNPGEGDSGDPDDLVDRAGDDAAPEDDTRDAEEAITRSDDFAADGDDPRTVDVAEVPMESGADEDATEEAAAAKDSDRRRARFMRRYRIQEVIRRRQILLVQVVKEERGNKGSALTTYISLAGRYCVLMPNTGRGGGISRKVTNTATRRKMREILNELEIPEGMGVIMRTAGMERNKSEVKRDFEYLIRAWDNIRELTLQSTAPTLIYEEANLIKRAIRDLYAKEMDEVWVEGNDAYQTAKKFMRLMMPSHAKRVQPYRDEAIPLFHRYQVESQLDDMLDPIVQLKSGGYIVIHSTEALVAIDVNSGRSTRERNIEETALKTNIEAAEEVARQLRLRDLAGLIVIDFIDMEVQRNLRRVEKVLKDAMSSDRARIQFGRISAFGLLELSRQRLRPSLQEASTQVCVHCEGMGYVRSTESMAVRVLRALVEEGIRNRSSEVTVGVPTSVALYILNRKRDALVDVEQRYGFRVLVEGNDAIPASEFTLERVKARQPSAESVSDVISMEAVVTAADADSDELDEVTEGDAAEVAERAVDETDLKRSRRRRRGRKTAEEETVQATEPIASEAQEPQPGMQGPAGQAEAEDDGEDKEAGKRRRRGRRGGRRRSRRDRPTVLSPTAHEDAIAATFAWAREDVSVDPHEDAIQSTFAWAQPADKDEPVSEAPAIEADESHDEEGADSLHPSALPVTESDRHEPAREETELEPVGANGEATQGADHVPSREPVSAGASDVQTLSPELAEAKPKRRGWWQRMME